MRSKAFSCLLRQEIAYFDRPENSSGAICNRLSSDAAAVQDLAGKRLGAICEFLALSAFGLGFGLFFSTQLTLIIFIFTIILILIIGGDIASTKWLKYQEKVILERASTVTPVISTV